MNTGRAFLAEQKSAGLILDYKFFTKSTGDDSTADWDISGAVMHRNYAEALGFNDERGRKVREIALKVFGSSRLLKKVRSPAFRRNPDGRRP